MFVGRDEGAVESGKLMPQGRMESDPVPTLRGSLRQEGTIHHHWWEGEDTGADVGIGEAEDVILT